MGSLYLCRNGDGFIDREEFGDILHMTGEQVTEEDIDEMFGESDSNKDGKIDFDGKIELFSNVGVLKMSFCHHTSNLPSLQVKPIYIYIYSIDQFFLSEGLSKLFSGD